MSKRWIWIVLGLALVFLVGMAILGLRSTAGRDDFTQWMSRGNAWLEKGDATNALASYLRVVKLAPENLDARLNLANAYLLADNPTNVIEQCQQALALEHNSGAAFYLMGCAYLRLNQPEPAIQAFQQSKQIDPAVNALDFQLGLAEARLGRLADALRDFEMVAKFDPENSSVHYQLSQLYQRTGQTEGPGDFRALQIHATAHRVQAGAAGPSRHSCAICGGDLGRVPPGGKLSWADGDAGLQPRRAQQSLCPGR